MVKSKDANEEIGNTLEGLYKRAKGWIYGGYQVDFRAVRFLSSLASNSVPSFRSQKVKNGWLKFFLIPQG
jgi:hypothetical protein